MAKIGINIKEGTIKEEVSSVIVGIDLGTTNSLVAVFQDGKAVTLKDADGSSSLMPSVIHFSEDGQVLTGSRALEGLIQSPERTIQSVKRLMGKSYQDLAEYTSKLGYKIREDDKEKLVRVQIDQRHFSPIELSSFILKALKARAEKVLNAKIEKAVITVPAYFNDNQRQATRDAGKLAGLEVLRIVNEPTAASLAYGIGLDREQQENIAVYDLGGGTFDVSILHIEDGIFEVLATNGDTFLGGDDIDNGIVNLWKSQGIVDTVGISILKHEAEKAKIALSHNASFKSQIDGIDISLTVDDLNQIMAPIIQKTLECCQRAMNDAGLTNSDLDHVVLVGGSTKSNIIKKAVSDFFKKTPAEHVNPDEVVAQGAAIQADILAGNRKDLLLLDITPLSLGIETVGGLMDVIIPRNTSIPIKAAREYTTSIDGQTNLKVSIYQGERDLVEDNRHLGEFILKGIPPMPAGLPKIEIAFMIDANGLLNVRAKELRSGVEQQVELRSQFRLSEEEMGKMLLESLKYAQSDMAVRALKEAQVEGRQLNQSMNKFITQHPDLVKPHLDKISVLQKELLLSIEEGSKEDILKATESLNEFTRPLAHAAMDDTIQKAMQGKKL